MDWIEVTARSVEDAKELALDRLGIVEEELEFEVLDERKSRLFGIGRGEARIRARVKPISRDKPTDRRRRRKPGERSSSGRGGRSGGGSSSSRSSSTASRESGESTPGDTSGPGDGRSSGSSSRSRRRGGRGRSGGAAKAGATAGNGGGNANAIQQQPRESRPESVDTPAEVQVESVPISTQAEHATKFTENLVRMMGFTATVRTDIDDEDVTVHVDGDNLGALVGPRGVTLQALEEVVRAVVQHSAGGHSAWVHVDVAGYRERRREALVAFARKLADEVRESGEAKALEPMGAADRKVVHDTVAEIDGVSTSSEGEDARRHVVIRPA